MDAILQSTERSTVAAAAQSDIPAPEGLPAQPVRSFTIVKRPVHGLDLATLAHCHVDGVDDPAESEAQARPWYLPQTASDADKLVAAQIAIADQLQVIIDDCRRQQQVCNRRIAAIVNNNQDLFETVAKVKPGGTRASWTGDYTRGTYTNMPGRLADIVVNSQEKAKAAGFVIGKPAIRWDVDTAKVRASDPITLLANGIALIDKPAVSFTPPKVDKGGNSGEAA